MSSALLALIVSLVEEAVKLAPNVAADIKAIFNKTDATPQDWADLKAKILANTYESYVPDTQIGKTPPASPS